MTFNTITNPARMARLAAAAKKKLDDEAKRQAEAKERDAVIARQTVEIEALADHGGNGQDHHAHVDAASTAEPLNGAATSKTSGTSPPDIEQAKRFIAALKRHDQPGEHVTFQTFDDSDEKRKHLVRVANAAKGDVLEKLNAEGAGIFITINATDGKGRKEHNIKRVRAVFIDADNGSGAAVLAAVAATGLTPHIMVASSPGNNHVYWLVDRDFPLDKFAAVQQALIAKFGTDKNVHDLPRVMRLPGFFHMKKPARPFMVRIVESAEHAPYSLEQIVNGLSLTLDKAPENEAAPEQHDDGVVTSELMMELRSAARYIVAQGLLKTHDDWTNKLGLPLASFKGTKHEKAALEILQDVSNEPDKVADKWPTYRPTEITHRSIFKLALGAGWKLTAQEIIEYLKALPQDKILDCWTRLVLYAERGVAEEVIAEVVRLTGKGVRLLKATLKDEHARIKQARADAEAQKRVGTRRSILVLPEDQTKQANEVEELVAAAAQPGEFVSFSSALAQVAVREIPYTHLIDNEEEAPPPVPQLAPLDKVGMLALAERVVVFNAMGPWGPRPVSIPPGIIDIILKKQMHLAPKVTGLILHPVVLPSGKILMADGLDAQTGLYLHNAAIPDVRPYTKDEACAALTRLRDTFLEGFEFRSALDADVALSMLFTGVERRLLAEAPGYALLARRQSSGKTTLARRTHAVLTRHDMPVTTFPEGSEEEMQKRLLAALSRAPTQICFDNLTDGTTLQSSALALSMTSGIYRQRVLGESNERDVASNTLMVVTGNNLKLGNDEVTRWLTVWLEPSVLRPQERTFAHPDVVGHAVKIREAVLHDVIGIIAGYLTSGARIKTGTRFPRWDKVVRQPLLWAGTSDLMEVFTMNMAASEDERALEALLTTLRKLHGSEWFRAHDVVRDIESHLGWGGDGDYEANAALEQALCTLRARDVHSLRSVGRALSAAVGKPTLSRLQLVSRVLDGLTRYRVEEWEEGRSFSYGKPAIRPEDLV